MAFFKAIRPFFPFSYREKTGKDLAISIVIYAVIGLIVGVVCFVAGFLAGLTRISLVIILVGLVTALLGTVGEVYTLAGIALSIMHFTGLLDKIMGKNSTEK